MSSVRVPRVHSGHPQTDAIHNTNPIGNIFSNKYAVEHSKLLLVIWQMLEKMYDRNGKKRVSLRSRGTLQQRQHRWKIAATRLCGVTMRYRNCHEIGYWPIIECEPESIVIPSFVPVFCILTTGPADFTTGPADFKTGLANFTAYSNFATRVTRGVFLPGGIFFFRSRIIGQNLGTSPRFCPIILERKTKIPPGRKTPLVTLVAKLLFPTRKFEYFQCKIFYVGRLTHEKPAAYKKVTKFPMQPVFFSCDPGSSSKPVVRLRGGRIKVDRRTVHANPFIMWVFCRLSQLLLQF